LPAILEGGRIQPGLNRIEGNLFKINGVTLGSLVAAAGTTLQAVASVTMANPVTLGGSSYVDTNGYALTLTGILSGAGSLVKASAGTLSVTGENTYAGGTTVNAGVLSVSGASPLGTGAVQVAAGASLGGTGTISGPVTVAGILKPGNSPGYLATGSSVTMTASSTYGQDIAQLLCP
jgi:autotransporter-associated beta strand protein